MSRTCHTGKRKVTPALGLLLIVALLLSGLALPAAQAAPEAPQATTIIAALSDYGSGETVEQTVATMIAGWNPAWIVTAGDNYHYQNCSTYATCVGTYYGPYVAAPQKLMPTLGNHDYGTLPMGLGLTAYNDYFTWLPTTADSQRRRYEFEAGDVHFFMLDGNRDQYTQAEWDNQTAWLQSRAAASTSAWNIAVLHQAPYSTGYYGDIAASQLPYGAYGIDFVISGHNHHFERLVKADGGKTVRYFIDGYGGSLPSGVGHSECGTSSTNATSEVCLANVPGAMKLTASATSITFEYFSSAGALQNTYTQVNGPEITTSVSSLAAFSTPPGTPSAAQSYTVAGSLLTADISITAPAGFEIATASGGPYSSNLTLTQSGGTVGATTVYARLTGASAGSLSGNIAHSSSGAAQVDVAVSGTVSNQVCVTSRISASADDVEERNDNGAVDLDGDTSTHSLQTYRGYAGGSGTLNWWGLRFLNVNVPQGATITSADVTFRANLTSDATASGMTLWGQLAANPSTFTTSTNNVTSRTRTTASATWSIPQWTSGSDYVTPDLPAVVQEIVNQSGWAANNAMVVIGQTTVTQNRSAISRDSTDGSTLAPLLEVCYTTAPPGPTITTSVSSLSPFSTTPGVPSAAQTYTVAGSLLTEGIVITAPAGFEIKTDSGTYGPTITLPQAGGAVGTTTIYVRLTGAEGTWSGNITHTSAGATAKNVAVSGSASLCYDASLVATADTYMSSYNNTNNYGAQTYMRVTLGTSGRGSLIRWDLSSIPANATVSSASLQLNVSTAGSATYNLYNMRRAWVEGTGSGSVTGDGATWQTYDGTNNWGTSGAANTSTDRYDTNLWGAGSSTFSSPTGIKTVALNADGLAVVQGWVDGSVANYGLTIQNYTTGSTDVQFSTRDNATEANRPRLALSYCLAPTTPYITTSGTLNAFSSTINVPSAEQSYTVSGGNLTGNIVITAPAGFQISTTSGSGFVSSVSLTPASGAVAPTTIYVRFLSSTLGTSTGNITHASAGATTRNVAVSGTIINGAPVVSLVQPADDATGVALAPTLQATVTDPEAETMSVSFYGRPVSTSTPAEDFTLVVIPDTQNLASANPPTVFNAMTQWIADNKTTQNIVFATSVGDIVNTASSTTEWSRADAAYDILDAAGVSYSVGPGNHDLGTLYSTNFGSARFSGKAWYQGYYTSSNDNYNNYSLFSASGMDFILINLQYSPGTGALDWADALLKTHNNRRGIVAQHDILNTNNSWVNQNTYNALSDNPNLFLMVCGHMHTSTDGSAYRLESRTGMSPVHVLMTDYQDYNSLTSTGYLRILTLKPATDEIYAQVYSPYVPTYLTDATNYEQFTMTYDMEGTAAAPFELIGTVNDVASGANASVTWTGRGPNTEYEWYAVVTDSASSTASAAWSFTTGAGGAAVPQAPVVTSIALSGSNGVTLAWDAVTKDVNGNDTTITKYAVYGSHDPYFTSGDLLGEPTATSFTHTGGSTGDTNWYYLVRAVNAVGESANSPRRTGRFGFILVPGTAGE